MDQVTPQPVRPKHCSKCPYHWGKTVGGRGNPEAPIVFVGESPGGMELAKGRPFVGPSGDLLLEVFPEGTKEDDYLILNAMQCMPPKPRDKTRALSFLEQGCKACNSRLVEQIKEHPRKVVVALGNGALWSLTNNYNLRITKERGRIKASDLAEIGIVASVHPAFLLHGGGSYKKFKEDIHYAWSLLKDGKVARKQHIQPTWVVAEDEEDVIDFLRYMADQSKETQDQIFAGDIETGGFHYILDEILAWGMCVSPDEVFIFPENTLPYVRKWFSILRDVGAKFCWHNGKFDIKFLRRPQYAIDVRVDEDTMLLNYSLDEIRGQHDLEQVSSDLLGAPLYKNMLKPYLKNSKTSYREIPKPVLYEYLARDVSDTKQCYWILKERLNEDKPSHTLYHKVLLPASELLADVEEAGIRVDFEKVGENRERLQKEIDLLTEKMNEWALEVAGHTINPNSPIQVGDMIYNRLKLAKANKGTGKKVLENLPQHPFIKALSAHRLVAKAYGTYVKPLENLVYPDGCVHSTYLIHGTGTGRLSSRDPNMQNQPRDPNIRGQFVAGEDEVFMECDLDQAELRSLTALSEDPGLIKVYTTPGMSIHKDVSTFLWGEDWARRYKIDTPGDPEYDEAKEEYMRTKALNFGIVYGREAPSIAEEFNVSIEEAQSWINGWSEKYPEAWAFIEKCRRAPLRNQNLVTPFGRRKRAQVVSYEKLKDLQNEAANFPHQSIASDITLVSAIKVNPTLKKMGVRICNLIHDAILMRMPHNEELMKEVAYIVTSEMEKTAPEWGITTIPFIADAKVGQRWGNLSGFKFDK